LKERAKWESLDLRNPWNHVLPAESREGTSDPFHGYVPGMGHEERDESDEDRELEELEALASAAGGPFPTIWEEAPVFHGLTFKGKTTHDASTQTEAQYTAQLVSVEPGRRAALGEKYWHFHNGQKSRGRSGINEDEDRTIVKHKCRKKEEMPPPEEHQWRKAIKRSREAAGADSDDKYSPTPMTWNESNQREVARQEGMLIKRGVAALERTSGAKVTKGTETAWDWLTPFDPSDCTAEATSGSGASASN
jgi:hypothetical protein